MASTTTPRGAETAGSPAGTAAGDPVRDIERDMADIRQELGKLSRMVSDMAQSRYGQFRDQAQGMAQDWTERGTQLKDEAVARAGAVEEELQRSVRERPLTAVAVAAGVGYLIGLLSRSHD